MEFKDSLRQIIEERGVNEYQIGRDTTVSKQSVMKYLEGTKPTLDKIVALADYFDVSIDRLLKGKDYLDGEVIKVHNPPYRESISGDEVFLYDIDAAANLKTLLSDKKQNIIASLRIPNIPKCDGALFIRGDSMYPLLKSGDIVAYKELRDVGNVVYGEMYIVDYCIDDDDYLVVKYVQPSNDADMIKLVSYNTNHSPMDIHKSNIRAMALVKASVRFNTMI